ncbi:unnamed protein product [Schistosoma mattheei]|uniref:Uncharacterized protein n=1 Tax=Schistosoma mattheei TaxID=31246 RepID=A0A183NPG3_9TREM|nr:unnamed protein product [Schistosoma mattheei]
MQDSDKKDKKSSVCEPVPLEWELTKVREYTLMEQISCSADDSGSESPSGSAPKSLSGMPTCVTHGGPAGTWLAIGSDSGSVFLINRHVQQRFLDEKQLGDSPYQVCCMSDSFDILMLLYTSALKALVNITGFFR